MRICDVSPDVVRVDLDAGGAVYVGAGVQGGGGPITWESVGGDPVRARQRIEDEMAYRRRTGSRALVWTQWQALRDAPVYLDPHDLEVLAVEARPADPPR